MCRGPAGLVVVGLVALFAAASGRVANGGAGTDRPADPRGHAHGAEPRENAVPSPEVRSAPKPARECPVDGRDQPSRGGDALACFLDASDRTRLTDHDALRLCEFAPSVGPVECYRRADRETTLLDAQIIDLCRCAPGTEPVSCFREAERETFLNRAQVLNLCRATHLLRLYRDCTPIHDEAPRRRYHDHRHL